MSLNAQSSSSPWTLLHPLAVWNLAVAQPLYAVLYRHPPFFTAHRIDRADLALFALIVSIGVPLAFSAVLAGIHLWKPRAAHGVMATFGGAGAGLVALQTLPPTTSIPLVVLAASGAGLLAATVYLRWTAARRLLTLCLAGALLFPLLLVGRAPVAARSEEWRETLPAVEATSPHPVVVLLFDEWPLVSVLDASQEVNRTRFPHLAELADSSRWFPNATTIAATTSLATPPILTGLWPEDGRRAVVDEYPINLFTLLSEEFALNVVERPTDLCPESLCSDSAWTSRRQRLTLLIADAGAIFLHRLAPAPLARRLPAVDQGWAHFWDEAGTGDDEAPLKDRSQRQFQEFIDRIGDYPRNSLHFLHLYIPHLPWRRLPDGRAYETVDRYPHGLVNQIWMGTEWETLQAQQRHLLQVGLVDTLVGRLNDRLEELGLADDTLLIVTSDHGTSFLPGRFRRNVSSENLVEIAGIPLFVKLPNDAGGVRDERNATTLDILPTILDSLGIEPHTSLPGSSLLDPPTADSEKTIYSGSSMGRTRGRALTYLIEEGLDRQPTLDRMARWFGDGAWSQLFRLSLYPDLLDRNPAPLVSAETPVEITLQSGRALDRFDPEAPILPIHLAGRLPDWPPERGPTDLAISVGRRIVATTQTFVDPELGQRFTALLDPERLRPGDNRTRLFVIEGEPGGLRLRATRLRGKRPRKPA